MPTLFVLSLLLVACGATGQRDDGGGRDGERLSVVATTTILEDLTREVTGEIADVSALMPAGSDPHNFGASARQLAEMQEADLVVANGADFEEQLQSALAEVERSGVPVFRATDHIEPLVVDAEAGGQTAAAADGRVDDGSIDPHFWQDPTRSADVVRALGTQIGELTDDPSVVAQRAEAYAMRLGDVDREIKDLLAGIPPDERTLVTTHRAFAYFADRYDFTIVGTVIPSVSTGAEPSARDLETLAAAAQQAGVRAVFTESTASTQLTETLAREVGPQIEVVELYSDALGGEGSEAATYVDMLRTNARRINGALRS